MGRVVQTPVVYIELATCYCLVCLGTLCLTRSLVYSTNNWHNDNISLSVSYLGCVRVQYAGEMSAYLRYQTYYAPLVPIEAIQIIGSIHAIYTCKYLASASPSAHSDLWPVITSSSRVLSGHHPLLLCCDLRWASPESMSASILDA
jgi:hypothetical protein